MNDEADLSNATFARLSTLLFQKSGITLKDYKKYLVVSRLARFVGPDKAYATFEAFLQALTLEPTGELMQGFVNALTTSFS